MADKNQQNLSNYKIPGARGPRNRQETEKAKDQKGTLIKLFSYFHKEARRILLLLLCVTVIALTSVYAPKLQSQAIDSLSERRYGDLNFYLLLMLLFYGIQSLFTLFQGRYSAVLSQSIVKRMRRDLFGKIVNLPIRYLDSHPHGDIMSRMTNDIENVSGTISQSLSSLVSGGLTLIGTVFMMFYLCPTLALLSCVTVILTITATKFLSGAMRKFYRKRQILLGNLNSTVEEMAGGYKTVAAYSREEAVIQEFNKTSDELTKVGIIAEILGGSMGPVMNVINNIGFVIIAAFGGYFAIKGTITIGVISAFIIYAKQFGRPIEELAQIYGQIQTAIASAERVFAIMDEPSEDKSGTETIGQAKGVITFKDVDFSYTEGHPVLQNFNLTVEAGQKVALVGSTGSGKTTVVNLLMRFYDIDRGEILIDGVNIKDINCNDLRRNTAIVLQDTVLFADTVEHNLKYSGQTLGGASLKANGSLEDASIKTYGSLEDASLKANSSSEETASANKSLTSAEPEATTQHSKNGIHPPTESITDAEMEAAAQMCHCHNMIRRLPQGYQTELTQAGQNLSQGQRQLLSIARAFLAKPKILILDEATSSVDTRTEKHIQDAMVKLMENRTSLIIAHRLSTIQDADRIVVMDHGRIVEIGSHEQLLAAKGRYYDLYMTQFAGQAT